MVKEVVQSAWAGTEGPFGVESLVGDFMGWPQADQAIGLVLSLLRTQQFGLIGLLTWIWIVVGLEWFAGRLVVGPREFVGEFVEMTTTELKLTVGFG